MEQDLYLHGLIKAVPEPLPSWTRPTDWLTIPALESTDDKVYLIVRINENTTANYVAFTATGNYTVDWGDGSALQNVASGVKAQHQYDWNDISADTLTSTGWRQALVTITPNGGVLSTLTLCQKHSGDNSGFAFKIDRVVEVNLNCPAMTVFGCNENFPGAEISAYALQRVIIGENNISDMSYLFAYCYALAEVKLTGDLSHVTNVSKMFQWCTNDILNIEFHPTGFINCTDFSNMFEGTFVSSPPLFDTSSGLNFFSMFKSSALVNYPLYDTSSATNFSSMFENCNALREIIFNNTGSVTNFYSMCNNCIALELVSGLTTTSASNLYQTFQNCQALKEVPTLNIPVCTDISYAFNQCFNLQILNITNTSNVTAVAYAFYFCSFLSALPSLNFSSVATGGGTCFSALYSISALNITGMSKTLDIRRLTLDRTAIVNIFNNLASGVVGQTITVTNTPGAPNLTAGDLLIATSKGWTVVT